MYTPLRNVKTMSKGVMIIDGKELVKQTLDQIPQANSNAKRIVGLVKEGGRITGYQLSDNSIVEKQQAVNMAKQGQIAGVGIAHRGDTEYLKSITTTLVICPLFLLIPKDNNLTGSILPERCRPFLCL